MMDDASIVTLYWQRSEAALQHTADKYGRYCHAIALGILDSQPDAELGMRENAASAALFRLRRALRTFLEQEGVAI